jgi:hypothetical protein
MRRAFRMHGKFRFGKLSETPEETASRSAIDGRVEIFYRQEQSGKPFVVHISWQPSRNDANAPLPIETFSSLQDFQHQYLDDVVKYQDLEKTSIVFSEWQSGDPSIQLSGVSLFEQYVVSEEEIGEPELQWLLVSRFMEMDRQQSSSLVLNGDAQFEFRFGLPIPFYVEDGSKITCNAFPITAKYANQTPATQKEFLACLKDFCCGISYPDDAADRQGFYSKHRKLGEFNISYGKVPGSSANLLSPFFQFKNGLHPYYEERWGGKDRGFALHDVFKALGLKTGDRLKWKNKFKSISKHIEARQRESIWAVAADRSIYFKNLSEPKSATNGSIIYRSCFRSANKFLRNTEDIEVSGWNTKTDLRGDGNFLRLGPRRSDLDPVAANLYVDIQLVFDFAEIHLDHIKKPPSQISYKSLVSIAWEERADRSSVFVNSVNNLKSDSPTLHADVTHLVPEQPLSFTPKFSRNEMEGRFYVGLSTQISRIFTPEKGMNWHSTKSENRSNFRMSLMPTEFLAPKLLSNKLATKISVPNFQIESNKHELAVTLEHDPAVYSESDWFIGCRIEPIGDDEESQQFNNHDKNTLGIIGALQFESLNGELRLRQDPKNVKNYSYVRPFLDRQYQPQRGFETQLLVDVDAVKAVAIDDQLEREDVGFESILVPLTDNAAHQAGQSGLNNGNFQLRLQEVFSDQENWHFTVNLYDHKNDEAKDEEYVVVTQQPFSFTKVVSQPLANRGNDQGTLVATFDSATRKWQYKQVSEHYRYILPPQVIGESADKPRRLEIHDTETVLASKCPTPTTNETENSTIVDYRLTPPTEIWVRPGDQEKRFYLPNWNTVDLFTQPDEGGPGVGLGGLRGEFLYGLSVGIDVQAEQGIAKSSKISELDALVGVINTTKAQLANPDDDITPRWKKLSSVIKRRPQRLEIWSHDAKSQTAYSYSRFTEGVNFALRNTALHSHPTLPKGPYNLDDANVDEPDAKPFRVAEHGLRGGPLWPIESNNLFAALGQNPKSDGGHIERLALTALGGDANQSAKFLNGLVTIISETRGGFIQRQQVEVIGRIACLWHRAKHVVIYERTVNPSAQFTPEEQHNCSTRSRRPILRKVTEYIELLEPERSYPDSPEATAKMTGFLQSVFFNSNIINVDSGWSEDVGKFGWKIPLWNRYAAKIRPQVYTFPNVSFSTLAEGDNDGSLTAQECLNPDNLYFFSDFQAGTDQTNQWISRFGIDCCDLPAAGAIDRVHSNDKPKGDRNIESKRHTNVSRMPIGHSICTWLLAPSSQKTMVNAHRAEKPIFVDLASITLERATASTLGSGWRESTDSKTQNLRNIYKVWEGSRNESNNEKDILPYWPANSGVLKNSALESVRTGLEKLSQASDSADYKTKKETVISELAKIPKDTAIINKITDIKSLSDTLGIKDLKETASSGLKRCEKLVSDTVGGIQRKKMLVLSEIESAESELVNYLFKELPNGAVLDKSKFVEHVVSYLVGREAYELHEQVIGVLEPAFEQASSQLSNVRSSIETARNIVANTQADVEATLEKLLSKLDEFNRSYDRSKPWSEHRLEEFERKLEALSSSVLNDAYAAVEEARQRLSTELDDMAQVFANQLPNVLITWINGNLALGNTEVFGLSEAALKDSLLQHIHSVGDVFKNFNVGTPTSALIKAATEVGKLAKQVKFEKYQPELEKLEVWLNEIDTLGAEYQTNLIALEGRILTISFEELARSTQLMIKNLVDELAQSLEYVQWIEAEGDVLKKELNGLLLTALGTLQSDLSNLNTTVWNFSKRNLQSLGNRADILVERANKKYKDALSNVTRLSSELFSVIDDMARGMEIGLGQIQTELDPRVKVLGWLKAPTTAGKPDPYKLEDQSPAIIRDQVILPALEEVLLPLAPLFSLGTPITWDQDKKDIVRRVITQLSKEIAAHIDQLADAGTSIASSISEVCDLMGGSLDQVSDYLAEIDEAVAAELDRLEDIINSTGWIKDLTESAEQFSRIDRNVRNLVNGIGGAHQSALNYADRVFDSVGNLDSGGALAAPNNLLRLYSAATSSPELAALESSIDRMRCNFDAVKDTIDTTEVKALFANLGDRLKAMGIELPFDQLGNQLIPSNLQNFDINKILPDFGGINLSRLFKGIKVPEGAADAIKISHEFDKKAARAWVQIDVNVPLPGRSTLFNAGPFKLDFVDSKMVGVVRLEASKDTEKVQQTGNSVISTNIEAVVAGQKMVRLEQVNIRYTKEDGLDLQFDPKKIKLNETMQFIQDTLGSVFGDEIGGLTFIKQNGIPVGVEHEFSIPPISLVFGTSGVSNIQITNRFRLVAFPDFLIANQFNLSRPELPFIFSIFIIGGTGYVQVDTEYRPFQGKSGELSVLVTAAAGGSALLGFSFAVVNGSVFIAISGVLTYRKLIGRSGGGLSVSMTLLIAGVVDVLSIATVYITLFLSMTYRDNGQIDALGRLKIKIKISRFFKITVKTKVKYKLRNGKATTTSETTVEDNVSAKLKSLKNARNRDG